MPKQIDWYYNRKGCKTCAQSDAFIHDHQISVVRAVDSREQPYHRCQTDGLLDTVTRVVAFKSKQIRRFHSDSPRGEVLAAVLGPTGNLRAPSLLLGKVLIVGFDDGLYQEELS